jgi:HSP20 family protein
MHKVSNRKAVAFGVIIALALTLATVGFAVFRGNLRAEEKGEESFGGVGLQIGKQEGEVVVVEALKGTPADEAGILAGDRIIEINGEPVGDNPDLADIVSKLRGDPGTEVTVTVKRGDETKTLTIKRGKIKLPGPTLRIIQRKPPRVEGQKPPEGLWQLPQNWPWGRGTPDKDAMKQYREALRKLEEARRKLWQSFPDLRPRWDWRGWQIPPDWADLPDWKDLLERPDVKEDLRMQMDVTETDDAITVRCDMPGMDKNDIDITLKGNVLTIKGERKVEEETKDQEGKVIRKERRFGSFARSFTVPGDIKPEDIKTSYENGVLTIVVPKEKPKPEKQEKETKIKVGTI